MAAITTAHPTAIKTIPYVGIEEDEDDPEVLAGRCPPT
jgi:hypothetical protein